MSKIHLISNILAFILTIGLFCETQGQQPPPGVPPQQFGKGPPAVHPQQHAQQQNFQPRQPVGIANAPPPPPPGKQL